MDRLDELRIFVAILDAGSLAGAARRVQRSTAAVTRALAALEARVGARLIDRTTRRQAFTEAGRLFADRARTLLVDYEAATTDAADDQIRGLIRITAPTPFGRRYIAPITAAFLDAHPAVQADLVFDDRNLDLIDQGIDVAVRIGDLSDSTFKARRVGEVRHVLVASPAYIAARGCPAVPEDLSRHSTIFGTNGNRPLEWRFGKARDQVVKLVPRLLANDVDTRLLAAKAGHGIARVLSYQAADGLADGSLSRILSAYEPPSVPVHLVSAAGPRSPKVEAFLDAATKRLRALPAIHATPRA